MGVRETGGRSKGWMLVSIWYLLVTRMYVAVNAGPLVLGSQELLDSVMCHTGHVSSCPGAFSDGNNMDKSKAWSVEFPDSHLGGSVLIGSEWTPQVHSYCWVQLLGHISVMLFCWQYLTVAISQSKQHPEAMVRIPLVGLIRGVTPVCIQTISATGTHPLNWRCSDLSWDWAASPREPRRGSNLSSDPVILSGVRLYSQCETARNCFSVDMLWHVFPTWSWPVIWALSVSVCHDNIKTSLTLRLYSLLSGRG